MRLLSMPKVLVLSGVLAVSLSCGSSTSSTSPTGTVAVITISVSPNPITATVYSTTGPTYSASWTTTIVESGGRGGTVQSIEGSVFDPLTGDYLNSANYDSSDLIVFFGTDRINPLGSMSVPQQTTYTLATGKAALLTVTVKFIDDGGVFSQHSELVQIQ